MSAHHLTSSSTASDATERQGSNTYDGHRSNSSDSVAPGARVVTLGMFILDEYRYENAEGTSSDSARDSTRDQQALETSMDAVKIDESNGAASSSSRRRPGGGGTYFALGARAFLPRHDVGQVIHYGPGDEDAPWLKEMMEMYDDAGGDEQEGLGTFDVRPRPDSLPTAVGLNIYRGESREFEFLQQGVKLFPRNILESRFGAESDPVNGSRARPSIVHFTASPLRATAIVDDFVTLGWQGGLTCIYEPYPSDCLPEALPIISRLCSRKELGVLSPNHTEALALLGQVSGPFATDEELRAKYGEGPDGEVALRLAIEKAADELAKSLTPGPRGGAVVIRCGAMGCCVGRYLDGGDRFDCQWIDAYHAPPAGTEHVVDVTGGGNAFLGGLAAGLKLEGDGDVFKAAAYGTVAASFAIEQDGLPRYDGQSGRWNGEDPWQRLQEVRMGMRVTQTARSSLPPRPRSIRHQILVCSENDGDKDAAALTTRLRPLLAPNYTVSSISVSDLITQPWTMHAALVVLVEHEARPTSQVGQRLRHFAAEGGCTLRVAGNDTSSNRFSMGRNPTWSRAQLQQALQDDSGKSLRMALRDLGLHVDEPPREAESSTWKGMPRSLLRPDRPLPLLYISRPGQPRPNLVAALQGHLESTHHGERLRDAHDAILLVDETTHTPGAWSFIEDARHSPTTNEETTILVTKQSPGLAATPLFDFDRYFSLLETTSLGSSVLYGEAVTSTQTLLDRNPLFLHNLPTPHLSLASFQLSGRGRGANQWLSPPGCLQFSLMVDLPSGFPASKLVFAQYLMALAVAQGLDESGKLGVRIKWPNDLYGEQYEIGDATEGKKGRAKLGGILVNSSVHQGKWRLVIGTGVNILNDLPTTSLEQLVTVHNSLSKGDKRPMPTMEGSLAAIMNAFDALWQQFVQERSFAPFLDEYLGQWLHTDQKVTLTSTTPPTELIVRSITLDQGLLRCERIQQPGFLLSPLDRYRSSGYDAHDDRTSTSSSTRATGDDRYIDLQPDGNSFDMMHGLIKTKTR